MAIIETSEEVIEYLKKSGKPFNQEPPHGFKKGFTYVRSIKLYVKEESHLEENCDKANKTLLGKKLRMLKIPEFIHFFNHVKIYNKKVYNNITRVRREHPWRIELLDAYFIKRKDDLYISTENRTNTEKLENALMEDRQAPGISLKSWLENPNSQGLPRPNIKRPDTKKDNLGYIHPKNNRVAGFEVIPNPKRIILDCDLNPSTTSTDPVFVVRGCFSLEPRKNNHPNHLIFPGRGSNAIPSSRNF